MVLLLSAAGGGAEEELALIFIVIRDFAGRTTLSGTQPTSLLMSDTALN